MVRADARIIVCSVTMLNRTEIAHGVSGAWRLMWGDGGGLYMLDRTREGFWRSFRVMLLVAPLQIFCLLIVYDRVQTIADDSTIVLIEALRYVIEWTAFPVILLEIARLAGWHGRYIGAIVALNWASVPVIILSTLRLSIGAVAPSWLGGALGLILMGFFVYWLMRILRETLSLGVGQALALALLNLWISITLEIVVDGIVGRLPGGA